ncbi:MAG: 6-phosphogluconolactonase [Thermodesulfobacteriota bacterium]|nr:6-phosphogluconolactonase [Thermodesulfobacteriota bacterium]
MPRSILIVKKEEMADYAAEKWLECHSISLHEKGVFSVALSGGETPKLFYKRLSTVNDPEKWNRTHLFQVDERFVHPDHPDSNYRLIKETLLNNPAIPDANIHPIVIKNTVEDTAWIYENEIKKHFRIPKNDHPKFDLIVLGIGNDGHIASIFPNNRVMKVKDRLVSEVYLNDQMHHRITLTLPMLNQTKNIIFLVTGKTKALMMKVIFEHRDSQLPLSKINSGDKMVLFLLDSDAASELHEYTIKKYQLVV